ncbi:GNAT family N-acetyltransferase [Priestia megaterium]|uniref:GNAT family N-acetyltransferase n=1 Tax=Priestia megaterium TaxID=1404 RepID=UPI00203ACF13|nr:GNAT family N-acetyltransferase [Priestia megaterium]MCM3545212.1 GNAT family N-acetyltransferase [Priestia megaterium]
MTTITIRQANPADMEALISLMNEYIVDFYKRPQPAKKQLRNLINHLFQHPDAGVQFIANQNDEAVGFSTLYFTFSTTRVKPVAILNDLYVTEKARGQKIGEKLFSTSHQYTKEHQYAAMSWETAYDNTRAQTLYRKMGGNVTNDEWIHYDISNDIL